MFLLRQIHAVLFISIAILILVLSCDGDDDGWYVDNFYIEFIIVNSAIEDYFISDSIYNYDQVQLYDLQFKDTIKLNGSPYAPTSFLSLGEALNYYEFILRGGNETGRSIPAKFLLNYGNGDIDTIEVTSESIRFNGELLSRYYPNFPREYYNTFIFYKD